MLIARCLIIIFQIWKANQNVFKEKIFSGINNFTKMFCKFILAPAGPPTNKTLGTALCRGLFFYYFLNCNEY